MINLNIVPDVYPLAYPDIDTICICDTGDVDDPEIMEEFCEILTHEYLHILICKFIGFWADKGFDDLRDIKGSY